MKPNVTSGSSRPWAPLLLASIVALAGCGGSDGGSPAPAPAPTPAPPANQPPVAAFTAAASLAASAPLALDASGSSDADGDPLTYSWNFGDGTRGGGAQLAHVFATAGDYTVTLTVADGRGGSANATRIVSVSAAAAAGAPASVQAVVTDSAAPLAGVAVGVQGGTGAATTAADGKADLMVATGTPQMLKFSKAGYADQFKPVDLIAGASGASINVRMLPREGALTLADAAAGGTLNGKDGALVTIPPNALIDANGAPVTGAVQVNVTPINVGANPGAFPGAFQGYQPSGARGLIASYGTVEYVLTQNGAPVHLAPGRKATVEIPIYTSRHIDGSDVVVGATIPLWSLDERTGLWVQEGSGTVVASAGSPSELALRAEVGHFSWWNCDQWLGAVPEGSYNPNARCCIRDTPNGPCKENSGDICRAEGSPKNPSNSASSARARSLAVDPSTRRIPTTVATASVPALAGGVLPMPANLDIDVVATARNGTYRGSKTFRGAAGVSETVAIDLLPVASSGNDVPITLPWDQVYSMQAVAQQAGYRLAMPVGAGFEVRVSPSGGNLAGTVRLLRPDATVFANASFGPSSTATIVVPTVAAAGDYRIEVTASGGVPGAFRLEATSLATCGSIETLTLPATPTINLGPKQSRCYDIAFAADEVIQIDHDQANNGIQGSLSLATANGVQTLTSVVFGERLLTGVGVAGTYRLRASNTTGNTGSLVVMIKKPVLPVLSVPGNVSFGDLMPTEERLFLVKPPADGLFHVALANTAGQIGVQFDPSLAWFTISGTPSARVQRVTAPVLPVLTVFRNTGTGTITVTTGAPTVVARETDIAGTVSAGDLRVYAFEGAVGDAFAYGMASPEASGSTASFGVYRPTGGVLSAVNGVNTVAESGPHTALVMAYSGTDNPFMFRINTAPAPVALTLTPPVTSQTIDLPLGQVVRYTFDVTQAELVGLRLATPGSFYVTASIGGVADAGLATPNYGAGPFAVSSPPRFVNTSANATLTLRSPGNALERARGNVTVSVVRPVPAVANFNVPVTRNLALHEWTSYRYTVPASGRYLLRLTTTASAPFDVVGTVWAPSTILTGYPGEFTSIVSSSGGMSLEGLGLLTAGNHTVTVRNSNAGPTSVPFTMTLVNLENPVALTVGGSPIAGSIDTDGERDYLSFAGVANQAVTVRVTAAFNGVLRVRKLNPSGNFADRTGELLNVGGTPLALEAAVERSVAFTIPAAAPFGSGTYIVEVAGNANATGNYSAQVVSP